jgi:4-hydroxy-3-polyprenylbenzoate decarboxylase
LPKREYMENAQALWQRLGLPALKPEAPWHGYSLGEWSEEWDARALAAARGDWAERSESYRQRRRGDVEPNTPVGSAAPEEE